MNPESRIWETRPFGSMRGGSELVIGLLASPPTRSCLLYAGHVSRQLVRPRLPASLSFAVKRRAYSCWI